MHCSPGLAVRVHAGLGWAVLGCKAATRRATAPRPLDPDRAPAHRLHALHCPSASPSLGDGSARKGERTWRCSLWPGAKSTTQPRINANEVPQCSTPLLFARYPPALRWGSLRGAAVGAAVPYRCVAVAVVLRRSFRGVCVVSGPRGLPRARDAPPLEQCCHCARGALQPYKQAPRCPQPDDTGPGGPVRLAGLTTALGFLLSPRCCLGHTHTPLCWHGGLGVVYCSCLDYICWLGPPGTAPPRVPPRPRARQGAASGGTIPCAP